MSNETLKTAICDALATWIRQRPGLDQRNYYSDWSDTNGVAAYRSEVRDISKDKRDAETLLAAVRGRDSITADDLRKAFKDAFSGRLTMEVKKVATPSGELQRVELEYTTGQYWPTEYRKAAAAVLASALWGYTRDSMPQPVIKKRAPDETGYVRTDELYDGVSAGDWLRKHFRKEFGSRLQRRWFN